MSKFSAKIFKLGINPCVDVPETILNEIFGQAEKNKGPIPVKGKLNGKPFVQTVVKYQGAYRLYINSVMMKDSQVEVGDNVEVDIEFDPKPRIELMSQKFKLALAKNKAAKTAFETLPPSHQKEILRYLNFLKTEESLERNIEKILRYLIGKKHSNH